LKQIAFDVFGAAVCKALLDALESAAAAARRLRTPPLVGCACKLQLQQLLHCSA
jgi:hypothetical protein